MTVLAINDVEYKVFNSWSEVTVKKARQLYSLSNKAPEELLLIYKEKSKGEDEDKEQIRLHTDKLNTKQKELDNFFISVLELMSDIPKDIITKTNIDDIRIAYYQLLESFVFGVLYFPLEEVKDLSSFKLMGIEYFAPKSKKVLGLVRPFYNEDIAVYTDASDVDSQGRKSEEGKYMMAELITAIIYREKDSKYREDDSIEVSELFEDILTCDIFHSALLQLSKCNTVLCQLFPNLYQSSDYNSNQASKESGLADFGWLNSIMTIAEMGVLNQGGLTPLESVRQTNLYYAMTVLSNMRATTDFQKIFRNKVKK